MQLSFRFRRSTLASVALIAGMQFVSTCALAATYYVGAFTNSTPNDDADCGTGKGSHPNPHPCATLAYWTANRRSILSSGDVVRLTGSFGPTSSASQCIIPAPGVTYEGRTAGDGVADNFTSLVIDAANTPVSAPCFASAIRCSTGCDFTNFTLRDMTLKNAPGGSGNGNVFVAIDKEMPGLVIDRVRFTGAKSAGLIIGTVDDNENNPCNGVRRTRDITVVDSSFDSNLGLAGLWVGCVNGGTISRSAFNSNGPSGVCEDGDGLHVGGWINGTVSQSEAHSNCEDNFDFSGNGGAVCDAATNNLVADRLVAYDAKNANFSFNHCVFNITLRDSFSWGGGTGFNQYACANRLKIYNNTFWQTGARAAMMYQNCRGCDLRNNIFRANNSDVSVFVDVATTSPETIWQNNVLVQQGTGGLIAEYQGGCPNATSCDASPCPSSDPQSPGLAAGWNVRSNAGNKILAGQLSLFQSGGDQGQWFGSTTGDGDKWALPGVVNPNTPSPENLHLAEADAVARGGGQALSPAFADYDGDARPAGGPWDIGADHFGGAAPVAPPTLLSVSPVP